MSNLFLTLAVGGSTGFCYDSANIFQVIGYILMIFKIVIPVILIILGMIDLGKAVVASKDDEIKKYYEENTVGDISAKHILIKVDTDSEDGLTDDEAKKKAEEIIKKLDKGEDFDTLAKENSDDTGSKEKGGDLGYFNKGDMVEEFETAAYKLKVNEYTKEPVKTTYGYHIILKTGEKDKPKLKEVKSNIIETLTKEKLENDKTLEVTTLDDLRKSYGLKFKDAKLKKNYNNYIKDAIKQAEESNSSSES